MKKRSPKPARKAQRVAAKAPALPAPLTPPDCDLTGLRSMMVDVGRVLDSDLFALASGEEFKASFALWCKAWTQTPAGSIPADERVLARFAGLPLAQWRGLADMALRGWIRCSDGRWYHPVVCEKVLAAWIEKLHHRRRSAFGNSRRHNKPLELDHFDQAIASALEHLHALDPALAAEQTRRREASDLPQGAQPRPPRTRKPSEGRGKGTTPQPPLRGADDAMLFPGSGEPETQWRCRLAEWTRNRFWNDTDWGPRPAQPACQAPPDLLAEFGLTPSPPSSHEGGGPSKMVDVAGLLVLERRTLGSEVRTKFRQPKP
jgi:hypothetical protein